MKSSHIAPSVHIDVLTSLRFLAAFYVLIFHSGGPALRSSGKLPAAADNFLANGYLCVTFFFVLSGFILTHVYGRERARDFDIADFGWARFARIYPLYLLSLVLILPFASDWQSWAGIPQFLLLQCWFPTGMVARQEVLNSNGPAWTLSVELLFYLLFPWLIAALSRQSTRAVAIVAAACCAVVLALRSSAIDATALHVPYAWILHVPLVIIRLPEFVYGICLGVVFVRAAVGPSPRLLLALVVALTAVLMATDSPWVAPVATILLGGIILLTPTSLRGGMIARCLGSRLLVLLGGASFALYILQTTVSVWLKALLGTEFVSWGKFTYLPLMLVASVLVFQFYEEPMRSLVRRLVRRWRRPSGPIRDLGQPSSGS